MICYKNVKEVYIRFVKFYGSDFTSLITLENVQKFYLIDVELSSISIIIGDNVTSVYLIRTKIL